MTNFFKRLKAAKFRTGSWVVGALVAIGLIAFTFASSEDVRPNATASEANGSCTTANAHTNMDDDVDSGGDGNECTASSNTADHDVRLQFNTPSTDPNTGANGQTFALLAKNSGTGNGVATVAMDLYCNGALVSAGSDQNLDGSYTTLTQGWTFDTGSCATDGSDVEVLLDCTADDNGGTKNDTSCDYEAVEWRADVGGSCPLDAQGLQDAQDAYKATNGKYFQVIEGNIVPSDYPENSVTEALGCEVSATEEIDVAEHSDGSWDFTLKDTGGAAPESQTATATST